MVRSGNPNPIAGRQAKRARRRPQAGTIAELTKVLWNNLCHLERHVNEVAEAADPDRAELCKLSHAASQMAATYVRAIEAGEIEARVKALEEANR